MTTKRNGPVNFPARPDGSDCIREAHNTMLHADAYWRDTGCKKAANAKRRGRKPKKL